MNRLTENTWQEELVSWGKLILIALVMGLTINFITKPTSVSGSSMYPTLKNADVLLLDRVTALFNGYQRGDIVIFDYLNEDKILVKRIIGEPGDHIIIEDNKVLINGDLLNEPYIYGKETSGPIDFVVPEDHFFVLGDNRPNSLDSRMFGPIHKSTIIGKSGIRIMPFTSISTGE